MSEKRLCISGPHGEVTIPWRFIERGRKDVFEMGLKRATFSDKDRCDFSIVELDKLEGNATEELSKVEISKEEVLNYF